MHCEGNMSESVFSKLNDAFKYVTSAARDAYDDANVAVFIKNTITTIENVIKTLDKMLKARNIDIGKAAESVKTKGSEYLDRGKAIIEDIKNKGLIEVSKSKVSDLKSKLSSVFKEENETGTSPPDADTTVSNVLHKIKAKANVLLFGKPAITDTKDVTTTPEAPQPQEATPLEQPKQEEDDKPKGLLGQIRKLTKAVSSANRAVFGTGKAGDTKPEEKSPTETADASKDPASKQTSLFDKLATKAKTLLYGKSDQEEDESEKKDMFTRYRERREARKAEVEKEKEAVRAKGKEKKGESWIGKILSGIMAAGKFLLVGIGKAAMSIASILGKGLWSLGGFIVKGLGSLLLKIVPGIVTAAGTIVKGIGSAIFSVVPKISTAIAGVLSTLLGGAGKAALATAGAAVSGVGSAIAKTTVGKAALAVGAKAGLALGAVTPVGWAILGGTAAIYGGYKLYRHLTKETPIDRLITKITKLRLLMYGFGDDRAEYHNRIFDLEMLLKDRVRFVNRRVEIQPADEQFVQKVMELFNVTAEQTDKYNVLTTWYTRRFIPAYRNVLTSLFNINSTLYLDSLDKLKPVDMYNFVTRLIIPGAVYGVFQIPVTGQTTSTVTKEETDKLLAEIVDDSKRQVNPSDLPKTETAPIQQSSVNKSAPATTSQPIMSASQQRAATPPPPPTRPAANMNPPPDQEGEEEPDIKEEPVKVDTKATSGLTTAAGAIYPGSTNLDGIQTRLSKDRLLNLDPGVLQLFTGMAREYNSLTGKNIPVNEAFRTREDQERLFRRFPDRAARPGNSVHEVGLGIDIASKTADTLEQMGLLRKYGFTRPIGGERWHLEPAGVAINPVLARTNPEHRASAVASSPGRGGGGYGSIPNSRLKRRNISLQQAVFDAGSTVTPVAKSTTTVAPSGGSTVTTATTVAAATARSHAGYKGSVTATTTPTRSQIAAASVPVNKATTTASTAPTGSQSVLRVPTQPPSQNNAHRPSINQLTTNQESANVTTVRTNKPPPIVTPPDQEGEEEPKLQLAETRNQPQANRPPNANAVRPAVPQTNYRHIPSPTPVTNTAPTPVQQTSVMNTVKMESLMVNQLNALTQIVTILTSIDTKFDVSKLKEQPPAKVLANQINPEINKAIPNNSVNLSRKALV